MAEPDSWKIAAENTRHDRGAVAYEPPKVFVLGPVRQLTFGSGGNGLDSSTGLHTKKQSDERIKRAITLIQDPIAKLRSL